MKKNLLVLAVLGLLCFALTLPCLAQDSQISKTVNDFYNCVERGDTDGLLNLFPQDIAANIKSSSYPDTLGNLGAAYNIANAIKNKSFGGIKFTQRKITVDSQGSEFASARMSFVVVMGESENQEEDILTLRKIKGKWLITDINN